MKPKKTRGRTTEAPQNAGPPARPVVARLHHTDVEEAIVLHTHERPQTVVFAGGGETGDAWMATALFAMLADSRRARPVLAAKAPDENVLSLAIEVLRESDCSGGGVLVREPTERLFSTADLVVTMGSSFRRELLAATPQHRREHWLVPGAVGSSSLERMRHVRDLIRSRVAMLVMMEGWGRTGLSREAARVTRPARTVEALASLP